MPQSMMEDSYDLFEHWIELGCWTPSDRKSPRNKLLEKVCASPAGFLIHPRSFYVVFV